MGDLTASKAALARQPIRANLDVGSGGAIIDDNGRLICTMNLKDLTLSEAWAYAQLMIFAAKNASMIAQARVAELEGVLTLAANRLHRCSVDHDTGTLRFIETGEWADEARATLAAKETGNENHI
jgi:hypothetical protein